MREPIENEYFNWLCAKVLEPGSRIYTDILGILHTTEFIWVVLGDRNRVEDGLELRQDFLRESRSESNDIWLNEPCSVFEMLIAFAKRLAFQTDDPMREWFWKFMTNLNLVDYRQVSESDIPQIEEILYFFVWRTYDRRGHGGLFPMRQPQHDQRKVELWYQWCEWIDDQGLMI